MERFNAMGREFNINNEVMCRIDDGEYVLYEDARIAIDTKQAEIDALKALLHVEAEANNTARDEIDRLREMVPKTIRPEIASPEPCGSPVICKCGWIVAVMDEFGESICDSDDHTRANFCGQCGAEMDYSEFDLKGLEEIDGEV